MQVNRALTLGLIMLSTSSVRLYAQHDAVELSAEFLEYLASYEQVDGEWIDPYEFAIALEQMASLGKTEKDEKGKKDEKQIGEPQNED